MSTLPSSRLIVVYSVKLIEATALIDVLLEADPNRLEQFQRIVHLRVGLPPLGSPPRFYFFRRMDDVERFFRGYGLRLDQRMNDALRENERSLTARCRK